MPSTIVFVLLLIISAVLLSNHRTRQLRDFDIFVSLPLRGLLALIIVGHHLGQNTHLPLLSALLTSVGTQAVGLFFFLSGYGLYTSYSSKGQKYLSAFVRKRSSRILPVFIFLTVLASVMTALSGHSLSMQVSDFIFYGGTPLPNSWFIYAILYAYAAFYLSALIGRSLRSTGLLFLAFNIAYVVFIWYYCHWGSYWYMTLPVINVGYYIGFFEKNITRLLRRRPVVIFIAAVLAVIITSCAAVILPARVAVPVSVWQCLWISAESFAAYLIIRVLGMIQWKPLIWIAACSLELYLIHGLVISAITTLADAMGDILFILTAYTLSIPLAWLLHRIFARIRDYIGLGDRNS